MEGDTFDQPGKGFAILGGDVRGDRGGHVVHDAASTSKMPCLRWEVWIMKERVADWLRPSAEIGCTVYGLALDE